MTQSRHPINWETKRIKKRWHFDSAAEPVIAQSSHVHDTDRRTESIELRRVFVNALSLRYKLIEIRNVPKLKYCYSTENMLEGNFAFLTVRLVDFVWYGSQCFFHMETMCARERGSDPGILFFFFLRIGFICSHWSLLRFRLIVESMRVREIHIKGQCTVYTLWQKIWKKKMQRTRRKPLPTVLKSNKKGLVPCVVSVRTCNSSPGLLSSTRNYVSK